MWEYMSMDEFRCKCGCNTNGIHLELIDLLDELQGHGRCHPDRQ